MFPRMSIILLFSLIAFSLTMSAGKSQGDTLSSTPVVQSTASWFNIELGTFFAGSQHQGGWGSPFSIHFSYGADISPNVALFGNVDYYHYQLARGGDMSGLWSPTSGQRQDVAVYASVTVAQILIAGLGVYSTKSDSVYLVDPTGYYMGTSDIGGVSKVRFFYIFGAKYDIHIVGGFYLPVGLFVRQSYGDRVAPIFFRTGLGIRL